MAILEIEPPDHRAILAYDYALINPLQVERTTWADLPGEPVVPWQFKSQPHLFPVLLELGRLDQPARIGLLDRMEDWERRNEAPWFSALLRSEASAGRLHDHLSRHMAAIRMPGRTDLLRPHDPRVFRHLSSWLMTPEQLDQLLGPIQAWAWREPGGAWRSCERGSEPQHLDLGTRLSDAQWAAYERLGEINRILVDLSRIAPAAKSGEALWRLLDRLLAQAAATYRLRDAEDRRLYAEQALCFHLRIHRHPELSRRLAQARAGEISYVGACADLDTAMLNDLAAEQMQMEKEHGYAE